MMSFAVLPLVFGILLLVLLSTVLLQRSDKTVQERDPTPDEQILQLVRDEVIANGGFINEHIEIRSINGMLTGMFAAAPIKEGERLYHIHSTIFGDTYCETVSKVSGILRTVDKSQLKPYERYLETRTLSHHSLPGLWSPAGIRLLEEMVEKAWTNKEYLHLLDHWMKHCDEDHDYQTPDQVDSAIRNAIIITRARTENEFRDLIPFHDVINHARGKANNAVDEYQYHRDSGIIVEARVNIPKGEQVAFDYMLSTNELFLQYGFLESYPQYWQSDNLGIAFHIREQPKKIKLRPSEDGSSLVYYAGEGDQPRLKLEVEFDEAPGQGTLETIQKELWRLQHFREQELGTSCHPSFFTAPKIDPHELKLLCDYHEGLTTALGHAEMAASILLRKEPQPPPPPTTNGRRLRIGARGILIGSTDTSIIGEQLLIAVLLGVIGSWSWLHYSSRREKKLKTRHAL